MSDSDPAIQGADLLRWERGAAAAHRVDRLAREEPLEIRVRGRGIAVTMRTPGFDDELAAGFLLSEGLLENRADIREIAHCRTGEAARWNNVINVYLAPHVQLDMEQLTRHVFGSSSCGLCGKSTIDAVQQHFPPVERSLHITAEALLDLPNRLRSCQTGFALTGGMHAAAVFDAAGRLCVAREDVGRHNAVDKVIGAGFLTGQLPWSDHLLLVSGRASFEIVQKALAARIQLVAAISAPSSLAVEFAQESGQTLVGFLRRDSLNLYTHPERVLLGRTLPAHECPALG